MKMIFKLAPLQYPTKTTIRSRCFSRFGNLNIYSYSWSLDKRKCTPSREFSYYFSIWATSVASDYEMR